MPTGQQRTYSRRSLHGQVANEIAQRIMSGEFAPGTILPNEAEFSVRLKVSRTALREAIKVLAAKGLVESRPKIGTRIRPRDHWNMLDPDVLAWQFATDNVTRFADDLFEVRQIIEPGYLQQMPTNDGWGQPFLLAGTPQEYTVCSNGKDGLGDCTTEGSGPTRDFDHGIVIYAGRFVQWPEGAQR